MARTAGGELAFGGLTENVHRAGVLRRSLYLPGDPAEPRARHLARPVAESWQLEGLMTLEFFELPGGELLVNEVAPRVHNSGHLTQDGGGVSQFEAQVRPRSAGRCKTSRRSCRARWSTSWAGPKARNPTGRRF